MLGWGLMGGAVSTYIRILLSGYDDGWGGRSLRCERSDVKHVKVSGIWFHLQSHLRNSHAISSILIPIVSSIRYIHSSNQFQVYPRVWKMFIIILSGTMLPLSSLILVSSTSHCDGDGGGEVTEISEMKELRIFCVEVMIYVPSLCLI